MNRRIHAAWFASVLVLAASLAEAAPRKTGTVTVNCPVIGATIKINGEEIGTVPMETFELKFGNHRITVVRTGLVAFEQSFMLRPGEDLVINAIPKTPRALLTILTNVSGGEVILDGKPIGSLPLREFPTSPGQHSLFIRKEGLQPFHERFLIGPHREYVMKPALKNRDGSPAGGFATFEVADARGAKKPSGGLGLGSPGGDLDLDLDMPLEPAPVASAKKPAASDFDLDLDMPLEPEPAKPAAPPVAVASAARAAPAAAPDPMFGTLPQVKPEPARPAAKAAPAQPPAIAARPAAPPPGPAVASFVSDPIAEEEVEEEAEDPTPFYQKKWVWGAAGAAVVAAVAVPIITGKTGGYIEQRNPDTVCRDCLVVMNR